MAGGNRPINADGASGHLSPEGFERALREATAAMQSDALGHRHRPDAGSTARPGQPDRQGSVRPRTPPAPRSRTGRPPSSRLSHVS